MRNKVKNEVHIKGGKGVSKIFEKFANDLKDKEITTFLYLIEDSKGESYFNFNSISTSDLLSIVCYCWANKICDLKGKDYSENLEVGEILGEFISFCIKKHIVDVDYLKKLLREND